MWNGMQGCTPFSFMRKGVAPAEEGPPHAGQAVFSAYPCPESACGYAAKEKIRKPIRAATSNFNTPKRPNTTSFHSTLCPSGWK